MYVLTSVDSGLTPCLQAISAELYRKSPSDFKFSWHKMSTLLASEIDSKPIYTPCKSTYGCTKFLHAQISIVVMLFQIWIPPLILTVPSVYTQSTSLSLIPLRTVTIAPTFSTLYLYVIIPTPPLNLSWCTSLSTSLSVSRYPHYHSVYAINHTHIGINIAIVFMSHCWHLHAPFT